MFSSVESIQNTKIEKSSFHKFHLGQNVTFGPANQKLFGAIEQIIFRRNRTQPVYLVEYWIDGRLNSLELHEEDIS